MEIQFLEIENNPNRAKASIHKNGKIGFNKEAAKLMNFEDNRLFKIGIDKQNENSKTNLYFVPTNEEQNVARIAKAGEYYYVNIAHTLEKIGIDYKKGQTILFDIEKSEYRETEIFILKMRLAKGAKKKNEIF